ncbi:hypothetical protein RB195_017492 [Necator americanus]|uniref:Uncharacterized protein n=1 Tax=Necator americanus TaxID=51031 RepID=A0ABR1C6J3_NECAM
MDNPDLKKQILVCHKNATRNSFRIHISFNPSLQIFSSSFSSLDRDSMRERSGSIPSTRAMLPICPSLTPSQVAAIRRSWKHINTKGLVTVLSRVFQRQAQNINVFIAVQRLNRVNQHDSAGMPALHL